MKRKLGCARRLRLVFSKAMPAREQLHRRHLRRPHPPLALLWPLHHLSQNLNAKTHDPTTKCFLLLRPSDVAQRSSDEIVLQQQPRSVAKLLQKRMSTPMLLRQTKARTASRRRLLLALLKASSKPLRPMTRRPRLRPAGVFPPPLRPLLPSTSSPTTASASWHATPPHVAAEVSLLPPSWRSRTLVAIVTVHLPNGFSSIKLMSYDATGAHFGQPGYETDLLYIAGILALCVTGAGPASVDRALRRVLARSGQA